MKVKRLKMRSFRAIADLTLEFDTDGPIVFIGVNGTGKSSILDCIRILLSYFVVRIVFSDGSRRQDRKLGIWDSRRGPRIVGRRQQDLSKKGEFNEEDIKQGSNEMANEIEIAIDGKQVQWSSSIVRQREKLESNRDLSELTPVANKIRDSWQERSAVNIPLVAYYPVNRLVMDVLLEIPRLGQNPPQPFSLPNP